MTLEELAREEDELRERVTALPPVIRRRYYSLEKQRLRDPDTYATLNWLFVCGLHHFYLGKLLLGVIDLGLMLLGITLLFIGYPLIGFAVLALVFAIEIPQLLNSQKIVYRFNNQVMRDTLRDIEHARDL